MKKLLILPLLVLLTGCVSYYYPETAYEDGVYYAEDDPAYVVHSNAYAGVAYYPWSSLDHFYLGYDPYPGYSFGYGYGSGFSFGISYGFSPWYYPYHHHGYYSPWYASYHYYPSWRPYRGYGSHHNRGHHKGNKSRRDDGRQRYAGNDSNDRGNRSTDENDQRKDAEERRNRDLVDDYSSSSVRRYVSTAPAGHSGNRGMVIKSREATKIGKSKLEPTQANTNKSVSVSGATQPNYSRQRADNEVRYRADAKPTRLRVEPVKSTSSSRTVVSAPVTANQNASRQAPRANSGREATKPPTPSSNTRAPARSQARAPSGNNTRARARSSHPRRETSNKDSSRQRDRN